MTLRELESHLIPLRAFLNETAPGTREAALRTNARRRELTAFQAYLFARIHGTLFGTRDILTVQIIEAIDYDALIDWKNGTKSEQLRLQLKELVSPEWNKKSGSAEAELATLLNGLPVKYPKATDLTVGIYANYGSTYMNAVPPANLQLGGLWVFGWANQERSRLFIAGGKQGEHRFFEPEQLPA